MAENLALEGWVLFDVTPPATKKTTRKTSAKPKTES